MAKHTAGISAKHKKLADLIDTSRFEEARQLAVTMSRKQPNDEWVWYMLAGIHAQFGETDKVIDCCKRVIRLNPNNAGAHYNLAIGLQQTGHPVESAASYRQVLGIEPNNLATLLGLGKLLGNEGRYDEALYLFKKAAGLDPSCSEAFYCTGIQLQALGRLHEAATAYQKAINTRPDYFEAINNLGHIYTEQGDLNQALVTFNSLLTINPGAPQAHNNIGIVYDSMGKASEAESSYRTAIKLGPDLADTRSHLAYLLASEGRTQEALDCFDANLALFPDHESSIAGKAMALEKLGKLDEAASILASAGVDTSNNPDLVHAYCTIMLRKNETASAIKQAERLLTMSTLPNKGVSDLSFVLGNLYEKEGNYPAAFRYFEDANRMAPCTYSHTKHVHYINSIIDATGKQAMASVPKAGSTSPELIFIVGMPRSGTSLVEQILASHPDVYGAGELRYMGDIAASFFPPMKDGSKYPANLSDITPADANELARRYIEPVRELSGRSRVVTDKMPHNFLYLALISALAPNAKVIHVTRSPLDNCLSLYFHGFNPMHSYTTDLDLLGRYYNEYTRLMTHWRETLDLPILEIKYEDVVDNLENTTRQLLDHCQLDWSDDCMKFYENSRFVKTPSYDQVRQPIYTSSVERWKNYEDFITQLKAALRAELTESSST